MTPPRLIQSYDEAFAAIHTEILASGAGDRIRVSVWILEPGETSEELLRSLRAAAERGAEVSVSVDGTNASLVQRLWERTETLLPRVRALAAEVEGFRCVERKDPDHAKYAIFQRASGPSVAIWGGINMGDRFRHWRDFVVRLEGALADEVAAKVAGEGEPFSYPPPADALCLVANVPASGLYEIRPAFQALLEDPAVERIRIAMAYLDRWGNEVLQIALDRGAQVELLMPKLANVYHDANLMSLERILPHPGLRAFAYPEMLHAKVSLAYGREGLRAAFFGSANLKRYSLNVLGELNALVTLPTLNADLESAVDALFAESEEITGPLRYWRLKAVVEERLG